MLYIKYTKLSQFYNVISDIVNENIKLIESLFYDEYKQCIKNIFDKYDQRLSNDIDQKIITFKQEYEEELNKLLRENIAIMRNVSDTEIQHIENPDIGDVLRFKNKDIIVCGLDNIYPEKKVWYKFQPNSKIYI